MHAHLITGPPVKRAILMSGSLYLSPPMPHQLGKGMLEACEAKAQQLEGKSLRECSKEVFKRILVEQNVNRSWLQEEEALANWETKPENAEELMIGDTELEVMALSCYLFLSNSKLINVSSWTVSHMENRYRSTLAIGHNLHLYCVESHLGGTSSVKRTT